MMHVPGYRFIGVINWGAVRGINYTWPERAELLERMKVVTQISFGHSDQGCVQTAHHQVAAEDRILGCEAKGHVIGCVSWRCDRVKLSGVCFDRIAVPHV